MLAAQVNYYGHQMKNYGQMNRTLMKGKILVLGVYTKMVAKILQLYILKP